MARNWSVARTSGSQQWRDAIGWTVLAVIGLRIAIGFPMTVFGAVTTARQRFALNNIVAAVIALVNGAATFALIAYGYRVRAVVAASTAISILGYAAYAWTARIAFPELRLRTSSFNAVNRRESWPMTCSGVD